MNFIAKKITNAKKLLAKGHYQEFLLKLFNNITMKRLRYSLVRNCVYLYLRRKYMPLAKELYVSNLTDWGGGTRTSSGGCGFKALTKLPTSARHAWPR